MNLPRKRWWVVAAGLCVVIAILRVLSIPGTDRDRRHAPEQKDPVAEHRGQYLGPQDPLPQFDVYLTWKGYDGWDARDALENTTLVWNGEELGKGQPASDEAIRRMQLLPLRSRVLIFPRYEESAPAQSRWYPEPIHSTAFVSAVHSRALTIIWSPLDQNGQLIPTAFDGEHFPLPP